MCERLSGGQCSLAVILLPCGGGGLVAGGLVVAEERVDVSLAGVRATEG